MRDLFRALLANIAHGAMHYLWPGTVHYMERPQSLFAEFRKTTHSIRDGPTDLGIGKTTPVPVQGKLPNVWPVPIDGPATYLLWKNYLYERFGVGSKPVFPWKSSGTGRAVKPSQKGEETVSSKRDTRTRSRRPGKRGISEARLNAPRTKERKAYNPDEFFDKPVAPRHTGRCLDQPDNCQAVWTVFENLATEDDIELNRGDVEKPLFNLAMAGEIAPKVAAMVRSIMQTPVKTLVILHSRLGHGWQ